MPSKADLQQWLKRKGWGPADAARHLKLNVRTIQRWLSGDRKIPNWLAVVINDTPR